MKSEAEGEGWERAQKNDHKRKVVLEKEMSWPGAVAPPFLKQMWMWLLIGQTHFMY